MAKSGDGISVTEKVIKIILAFTPGNNELGTMDLSEDLGYNRSTVNRILKTLTRYNFLQQDQRKKIQARLGCD